MIKKFKEDKGLRKDHAKKIRIKIQKIKELQLYQRFQKMLTMKIKLRNKQIKLRILQVTKRTISKLNRYQLIVFRILTMDPIDNK
jgi:hypothetical protein